MMAHLTEHRARCRAAALTLVAALTVSGLTIGASSAQAAPATICASGSLFGTVSGNVIIPSAATAR
jgi:hypothetical protein